MKQGLSLLLSLGCCSITQGIFFNSAIAQVTPDGTTSTTVNTNGNDFTIENGDIAGSNLFHSFRDFSIPNGGSAFFDNNADIANIFSRVTGGNISNIDGLIRANNSANLFLINPAGIIFGAGAKLDLGGGSFYGSTADSILFEDGEFSATNLDNPPLLTVNAPIGLNLRDNPQPITNRSTAEDLGLEVNTGEKIVLVGGDIDFEGGKVSAPGGRIELGGLSAAGTVTFNDDGSLSFPDGITRSDVSFTNSAALDVRADGGGFIGINAQNLELRAGSQLTAGINEEVNSPEAQAGDIDLNIVENITIDGVESGIFNNVGEKSDDELPSSAVGNAGKIDIETGSLFITPGGRIGSTIFGQGDAGDITVNARENIEIQGFEDGDLNRDNPTGIFSNLEEAAKGDSGTISISSNSLSLSDRAQLRSSIGNGGEGTGGDLEINTGSLTLNNRSRFTASVGEKAEGMGGNIEINADTVLLNRSRLTSELGNEAVGKAGNIEINADSLTVTVETLKEVDGRSGFEAEIEVEVENDAQGDAGDILINTNSFSLSGNSDLQSTIKEGAEGNAGDIIIKTGLFSLDKDARITTSTSSKTMGNAGKVQIDADTVRINDGSRITSITRGEGDAGTIEVNASDSVIISGFGDLILIERDSGDIREGGSSGLFTSVDGKASGQGGNIAISTPNLKILDGAVLNATVGLNAQGGGGSIFIDADTLEISNGGQIIASSLGSGDSGDIELDISDSIKISGSDANFSERFIVPVRKRVEGGETEFVRFLTEEEGRAEFGVGFVGIGEGSQISGIFANTARDSTGNGGTITIGSQTQTTKQVVLSTEGTIAVNSDGTGNGGNIELFLSDRLELRDNGLISARSSTNSGGNITINAEDGFVVAFPSQQNSRGNDIIADAPGGEGGDIIIEAQEVLGFKEGSATDNNGSNDVDASGQTAGVVEIITPPDVDALQGSTQLPTNPVESDTTVAQACQSDRFAQKPSGLIVKGKGGIPPLPTEPFNADAIIVDGRLSHLSPQVQSLNIKPISTSIGDIYPARGIIKTEDGQIILTAYSTDSIDSRTPQIRANCTQS